MLDFKQTLQGVVSILGKCMQFEREAFALSSHLFKLEHIFLQHLQDVSSVLYDGVSLWDHPQIWNDFFSTTHLMSPVCDSNLSTYK